MKTVTLDTEAVRKVLSALAGQQHEILELQALARGSLPGYDCPIQKLIDEYNAQASAYNNGQRDQVKAALDTFLEKTQWVQDTCAGEELGMHRADVLRKRINDLQEEVKFLRLRLDE